MTPADPKPVLKRKRKTSAERKAAREAKAEAKALADSKPIDPMVWMILGGLILFIALWTWLDPVTFAEAGQPKDWSIFQLVPLFLIRTFDKGPAVLMLTVLGGIPFLSGLFGWLRKRLRSRS
jgi:hypothetical protein